MADAATHRVHAFSVDVEDWFQGICLPPSEWGGFERRVEASMSTLLAILNKANTRATCFILGRVAEDHPNLVRDIHAAGHEVASHGFSHQEVYKLSPDQFRDEIRRSIDVLEDLTGQSVIGYRAPYFSITSESLWALDILIEEGIKYDSSIHPIFHHRCGIPGAARTPSMLDLDGGRLLEAPVSTWPAGVLNVPVGGGTYMRMYPYSLLRVALKSLDRRGEVIGIYTHPWEVDEEMPRISMPPAIRFSHYHNLASTRRKLEHLLEDFRFTTYREAYKDLISQATNR